MGLAADTFWGDRSGDGRRGNGFVVDFVTKNAINSKNHLIVIVFFTTFELSNERSPKELIVDSLRFLKARSLLKRFLDEPLR